MAVAKTNATKKTNEVVATKSNAPKAETKKVETAAPAKSEVKPAEKTVVKEETSAAKPAAKTEVKKESAAKKTTVKKPAKKTTKKGAKRGPKPASERTIELHVQYGGREVSYTDLVNRIKDMWKEQGKRETSLKSINVYVKPEEFKAYYVINDDVTGEIDF